MFEGVPFFIGGTGFSLCGFSAQGVDLA